MTVYVDDMNAEFHPPHIPGRVYIMCHMVADSEAELHAMADKIGIARRWYQGDHYDVTKSAKKRACNLGAIEISWRELGRFTMAQRRGQAHKPAPLAGQGRLF